jgi:hypothetical protein
MGLEMGSSLWIKAFEKMKLKTPKVELQNRISLC